MDFTDYTAGANDSGRRLDKILKHIFKSNASVNIFPAIRKRLIKINNARTSADYTVNEGDIISIASFLLKPQQNQVKEIQSTGHGSYSLDIIFKNQHIMIINKPYGINVQPSHNSKESISQIVASQYRDTDSISFAPAPLHRLDRNTTGILAISQSHEGAVWFSNAISSHSIKKTYIGIAEGILKEKQTWTDSIENQENYGETFHKVILSGAGKKAITHAYPLAKGKYRGKDVSLIQYQIETGRKHQIRLQTSIHGHPLLGDNAYNSSTSIDKPKGHSFFLHAINISVPTGNPLGLPESITAPLPDEFKAFLQNSLINWDNELII